MNKTKKILKELDELQDNYCEPCDFKNSQDTNSRICTSLCRIGLKMQELGDEYEIVQSEKKETKT